MRRALFREGRLLILLYHRVCEPGREDFRYLSETLGVSPARFADQMAHLSQYYTVLPLDTALRRLDEGPLPPDDILAITFDDGYRDNLTDALPALSDRGLTATIFLATDHIGTNVPPWFDQLAPVLKHLDIAAFERRAGHLVPAEIAGIIADYLQATPERRKVLINTLSDQLKPLPHERKQAILEAMSASRIGGTNLNLEDSQLMLDWSDVRTMAQAGVTFGSHSCSHPTLTHVPPATLDNELAESKRVIEENLAKPCRFFAYPNGSPADCPPGAGAILARLGYDAACANIAGLNTRRTDRMMLRRIAIGDYPAPLFALVLEFWLLLRRTR